MAVHVADYNEWARRQPCPACRSEAEPDPGLAATGCGACAGEGHLPLLSLVGVEERDYSGSWPAEEAAAGILTPAAGEQLELPA